MLAAAGNMAKSVENDFSADRFGNSQILSAESSL